MLKSIVVRILEHAYHSDPSARPESAGEFAEWLLKIVLAPSVMARAKDPHENEPPLKNPTALQRELCTAISEYYLAVNPKQPDKESRAQNACRVIASHLTQAVVAEALARALDTQVYRSAAERASFAAEDRWRNRPKPIKPLYRC